MHNQLQSNTLEDGKANPTVSVFLYTAKAPMSPSLRPNPKVDIPDTKLIYNSGQSEPLMLLGNA